MYCKILGNSLGNNQILIYMFMKSMRNLLSMMSVALLTIFAIGCEPSDDGNGGVTFAFTESSVTANSAEIIVTPSDKDATYYAGIVVSADIADKDDASIISDVLAGVYDFATLKGVSPVSSDTLIDETDYTVVAFAYGATEKVARHEFRTAELVGGIDHDSFEITIEVSDITAISAVAKATPNSGKNQYYFRVHTVLELKEWGIYENDLEIIKYIHENPNVDSHVFKGPTTLNCALSPEVEYVAIAYNLESYKEVLNGELEPKLFRYEFKTPEAPAVDPDSLFTCEEIEVSHQGFKLNVYPSKGDDALWTYYVFEKKYYEEYVANRKQEVVMRAYYGLYNLGQEYDNSMSFNTFINEVMGIKGAAQISNYEPLKTNYEYVVAMFYMDPAVEDPTSVYDYNYVAVEFKTLAPNEDTLPTIEVSDAIVEKVDSKYYVKFQVFVNEHTTILKQGANLWNEEQFGLYWDPEDWNTIRAFFWLYPVDSDTLTQAKSDTGCVLSFDAGDTPSDYVFFFEAVNAEGAQAQQVMRVTPDMF